MKQYQQDNPGLKYVEIDAYTEHGIERGMSLQIMAVPCLVVEGEIKLSGWPFTSEDITK